MDFDLTEDQKEIKRVAHELLAARSPLPKVREAAESGSYNAALSRELVELGWPGIAVSEEHGGQGLGTVELAVLAEELGYACASAPLVPGAATAPAIEAAGQRPARALAPGLASGELRAGLGTRELVADAAGRRGDRAARRRRASLLEGAEASGSTRSTRLAATLLASSDGGPTGEPLAPVRPTACG